jgi:hypothetical protein
MAVEVQLGDFVLVPIPGTAGKLISFGEWLDGSGFTDYDHAEIYVGNPEGLAPSKFGYTFGAYPGGAMAIPLATAPADIPDALWSCGMFYLTDEDRATIVKNALALTGTPYSAADYFALAAHRLHLPVPFLKKYVASSKHMICSQLVDYVYMESNIHLFNDGRWPGYVTPADLASVIKSRT